MGRRPRIGLALGSGSARGWAHIGVIDGLIEAGVAPDIVCGTSIGSLVGAAHVAGKLAELKGWAEAVTWREIVSMLDLRLTGGGLIDGRQVVAFLRGLGITEPIESYATPYAAVATDLETGREIWLRSGSILDAVRASIGIPGILSPARLDGDWLLDGGLVNPVPVSLCRALGAEVIVAVNLNGDQLGRWAKQATEPSPSPRNNRELLSRILGQLPANIRDQVSQIAPRLLSQGEAAPSYFDVVAGAIDIMQDLITRARLAGEPPHVMLAPRLGGIGLMDYHRAAEAIAEGRACVEQALPMLKRYL